MNLKRFYKTHKKKIMAIGVMFTFLILGCCAITMIVTLGSTPVTPEMVEPAATEESLPTNTPEPTSTPEPDETIHRGTHRVGVDISPGIYAGMVERHPRSSCYWKRLSDLSGDFDSIKANGFHESVFYVEILDEDYAFKTTCDLFPIEDVPEPAQFYSELAPGMYIVGRDISHGLYRGEGENCYWKRLSCLTGDFRCIITNQLPSGQFFVDVSQSDVALSVTCRVQKED